MGIRSIDKGIVMKDVKDEEPGFLLIGRDIRIMNRKDDHYGKWATVVGYEMEHKLYQAKMKNPPHLVIGLARSEFWVVRGKI